MLNRIKSIARSLALLLFFAVVAATTLTTTHTSANASPNFRQEHWIYYYTDASHTTMCGWYVLPCNNSGAIHNGCVTEFWEDEWYDC